MLESIELFTGAGGLALGTHAAGFRHKALVEWNADACATIRTNAATRAIPGISDWNVVEADARSVDFERFAPVDLVAGGPSCQPFSIGGKHRGTDDDRNVIPEFVRAVRTLMPRAFVFENVRGLTRPAFATYFAYVVLELTHPDVVRRKGESWTDHHGRLEKIHTAGKGGGLRYNVVHRVFNAADYGVPQVRHRVFVVGFREDTGLEWNFPKATHSLDALLHSQFVDKTYWDRHGLRAPKATPQWLDPRLAGRIRPMMAFSRPWQTVRDKISDLPAPRSDRDAIGFLNHRLIPGARSYAGHTGSLLDMPSKTLKAGAHGVPGGENMIANLDGSVRYFTVREAARMQTFPDQWRLEGAWSEVMRQIGNAVPMELAKVVAKSVANALRDAQGSGSATRV